MQEQNTPIADREIDSLLEEIYQVTGIDAVRRLMPTLEGNRAQRRAEMALSHSLKRKRLGLRV